MIPFTAVALALAPSVPMPDAVLAVISGSHLALRHQSDALLVVWDRVLWDWRDPGLSAVSQWMESLDRDRLLFLRTTLGTCALRERIGSWTDNPFALRYDGAVRYELNGRLMHVERMSPHPGRLVRQYEHGRMLISRFVRGRQPETARLPAQARSSRSYPRLPTTYA